MTADCSPSWTSWTIKIYVSFKLFSFVPEVNFLTYLILQKKKKIYTYIYIHREREKEGERIIHGRVDMEFLVECLTR